MALRTLEATLAAPGSSKTVTNNGGTPLLVTVETDPAPVAPASLLPNAMPIDFVALRASASSDSHAVATPSAMRLTVTSLSGVEHVVTIPADGNDYWIPETGLAASATECYRTLSPGNNPWTIERINALAFHVEQDIVLQPGESLTVSLLAADAKAYTISDARVSLPAGDVVRSLTADDDAVVTLAAGDAVATLAADNDQVRTLATGDALAEVLV